MLKENYAFKTTNFTGLDGKMEKETLRSHLILKTHSGTSPPAAHHGSDSVSANVDVMMTWSNRLPVNVLLRV